MVRAILLHRHVSLHLTLIGLCWFLNALSAGAQQPNVYQIKQVSLPDVYSNRNITDLCQDHLGVLWIGSKTGLYLYDGTQTVLYQPANQEKLLDAQVYSLAEDDRGYLWIGTSKGVHLLSPQRDDLLTPSALGLPDSVCQTDHFIFCEGATDELFILSNKNIFVYSKGVLKRWRTLPPDLVYGKTLQMFYSPRNQHLYFYDLEIQDFFVCDQTGPVLHNFTAQDAQGRRISTDPGAFFLTFSRALGDSVSIFYISDLEFAHNSCYFHVDLHQQTLQVDASGPIEGILPILSKVRNYLKEKSTVPGAFHSLSHLQIQRLRNDTWAFSSASGIFLVETTQQYFRHVKASSGRRVRAIHCDRYGRLIYGTYDGTFWQKPDALQAQQLPLSPLCTWSIYPLDEQHDRFVAEGDDIYKRLFLLQTTPEKVFVTRIDSSLKVPGRMSYSMAMASDSARKGYWHTIGTKGKYDLVFFNAQTQQNQLLKPRFKGVGARAMLLWKDDLWIGGFLGLYRILRPDPVTGILNDASHTVPRVLHEQSTNALYGDQQGNLWIGTNAHGLFCYQRASGQYQQFTTADGLPENSVFSILAEPGDSVLWLGTGNGLSRFAVRQGLFTNFYTQDGLSHNEFNTGSAYKARDGVFYMGGQNGINYFDPTLIKQSLFQPLQFAMIQISTGTGPSDKRSLIVSDGHDIQIAPTAQLIEINFQTDDYLHNEQVVFRYRIPDLFDGWQILHFSEKALFTQLPSGRHVVEVQAKSYRGSWSAPMRFTLVVLPPWYETWWFRLLVITVLAATLYGLYQLRIRQLRREFDLRQQISDDLHDTLGSRMYLMRTLANQIVSPVRSEQTRQKSLQQFNELSRDIFQAIRDFIWAFDPKQDELHLLFNRMDDFAENYLRPILPALTMQADTVQNGHKISPRLKHHLLSIYQELLTNMVKHTHSQHIRIQLQYLKGHIALYIVNEHLGQHTSPQPTEIHRGQESLKIRLEELKGTVHWEETEGVQQVWVRVPV